MNFEKLLSDIFGEDFMDQFKSKRPAGYVDLMAAFESRKRSASPLQTSTSNISLPFSFINFFKKTKGITVRLSENDSQIMIRLPINRWRMR